MISSLVLVDTSVWVEFFNRPDGEHHREVARLLDNDRVAVIGIIAAEILRGCRTQPEREAVEAALAGLHCLEVSFARWLGVGKELFDLRRRGITASLSDAAIAYVARESGAALYTLDRDFDRFSGIPLHDPGTT